MLRTANLQRNAAAEADVALEPLRDQEEQKIRWSVDGRTGRSAAGSTAATALTSATRLSARSAPAPGTDAEHHVKSWFLGHDERDPLSRVRLEPENAFAELELLPERVRVGLTRARRARRSCSGAGERSTRLE